MRFPVLYQRRMPSPRSAESTGRERIRLPRTMLSLLLCSEMPNSTFSITLFSISRPLPSAMMPPSIASCESPLSRMTRPRTVTLSDLMVSTVPLPPPSMMTLPWASSVRGLLMVAGPRYWPAGRRRTLPGSAMSSHVCRDCSATAARERLSSGRIRKNRRRIGRDCAVCLGDSPQSVSSFCRSVGYSQYSVTSLAHAVAASRARLTMSGLTPAACAVSDMPD
ncbi:hypothetical protein SDC9_173367 [bioreactor metagenome]|uniref:Uncharacterized protein n=1 Tax=bioreactor metagenome TaxID=1076179 RepID=A0A645GIB5_9ZZZZ